MAKVEEAKVPEAELVYVTPPTEEQLDAIRAFLKKKLHAGDVRLHMTRDSSIGGGFILKAGDLQYDWSTEGRVSQLRKALEDGVRKSRYSSEDIIDILKGQINDFSLHALGSEVGTVVKVGDGIATVTGIQHAMYGEVVVFEDGTRGMVMNIKRDMTGCILFGRESAIREGARVSRTGRRASIPVGDMCLGRVINALGDPIDGAGELHAKDHRPIENPAPGIVDRKSVSVPLSTGILAIDSMFPIGRGQRELIIGDRQTGKTSIAVDTIINQRGQNVVCIYVAIGQKASTVAGVVDSLRRNNAMDYTCVMSASASDPASEQYIAPYAGTALAEYFMYQGRDVLIVYDDLSKHAVAYRAISLLLGRPPGREAYPGDVFYLHSRLLERSSRLTPELGGGSITALPIIETQAGDVSAYIPTNVISITDGQIFLETNLFLEGQRPAVNVGLSVSRVGGAAQTKAMKKAAGSIRIDLAQYREMAVFTQFSSDLDDATKKLLGHGGALMQILRQPNEHPLSMAEEVVTLLAANSGLLDDIPREKVSEFQHALLENMNSSHADIMETLTSRGTLAGELGDEIGRAAEEFKKTWQA